MPGTCQSWTILTISVISFALALTSILSCRFVLLVEFNASYSDYRGFGPLKQELDGENCEAWPDFVKDQFFGAPDKISKAFGILTVVITGFSMILMALVSFIIAPGPIQKTLYNIVRVLLSVAIPSQLAMFAIAASDLCLEESTDFADYCIIGPVGIVACINAILLLVASIMGCCSAPPEPVFVIGRGDTVRPSAEKESYQTEDDPAYEYNEEALPEPHYSGYRTEDYPEFPAYEDDDEAMAPPKPRYGGSEAEQITVEIMPDGTKKTTKVHTNPNGSQTITTTIEKAK